MVTSREAAEAMVEAGIVVVQCVVALQSENDRWKELGLSILTKLNEPETTDSDEEDACDEDEDHETSPTRTARAME